MQMQMRHAFNSLCYPGLRRLTPSYTIRLLLHTFCGGMQITIFRAGYQRQLTSQTHVDRVSERAELSAIMSVSM